jgi:mRNA interferase RelE/StbE
MKLLSDISDRRIREKIGTVIGRLTEDPEKQGKALLGELAGFRSIRAVGQRYRIMYQIRGNEIVVVIVAVGIRRDGAKDDIYNLAKKLFRLGLLSE